MTQTCTRCGLFHPQNVPCVSQTLALVEHGELAADSVLAGRYRILRTLHHGGMSVVYLAEDATLGKRYVAVKELRVPASAGVDERHEAEAWFAREAYILSILNHPLVPEFYSSFSEGGTSYIVQEFADGENLNDVVRERGSLPEDVVLEWAIALCGLLSHLHGLDDPVLFRDLKPSNIVLRNASSTNPDRACPLKVVDFGIARHYKPKEVGTVIGTPGYAPPEQYQGLATPQSDVYALGATLHRLLTGYDPEHGTPFCYPSIRAINPLVSSDLADIVEKAIRLDPAQRFATADEFAEALVDLAWERGQSGLSGIGVPAGRWYHGPPSRSRQAFRWTALVVCLMMVAPGVFSVLAGMNVSTPNAMSTNLIYACPPAATDGDGGPYPAQDTSSCLNQTQVVIQVLQDPAQPVGFAPSNIMVDVGTKVTFWDIDSSLNCTVTWSQDMTGIQTASGRLMKPGDYQYGCQGLPDDVGLVHVK